MRGARAVVLSALMVLSMVSGVAVAGASGGAGTASTTAPADVDAPAATGASALQTGSGGTLELGGRGWAEASDPGDLSNLDLGGQFAIEFWVKYNASSDEDAVVLTKNGIPGQRSGSYMAYLEGTGDERRISFEFNNFNDYFTSDSGIPAGQWTHVALTFDGSTRTIYINGQQDAQESENSGPGDNNQPLIIGANAARSGNFLKGQVEDVRIWQTSRNLIQVESNYMAELSGSETGLGALYQFDGNLDDGVGSKDLTTSGDAALSSTEANPLPPLLHASPQDGQVVLNWSNRYDPSGTNDASQYRIYRDGTEIATVGGSANSYVDTGVSNGQTYDYTVRAIDSSGNVGGASKVVRETPYAERGGGSLDFDGRGYATATDRESLDLGEDGQPFAISFWVKYNASSDEDAVVLTKGGIPGSDSGSYMAYLEGTGEDRRITFEFNAFNSYFTSDSGIQAGVWTHVTFTTDGSTRTIYINGERDAQESAESPGTNNAELVVGADDSESGHFLNGSVDDLRIWTTNRQQSSVEANWYHRLTGDESGLSNYWRFNELGESDATQSSATSHGELQLEGDAEIQAGGAYPVGPHAFVTSGNGNATVYWENRTVEPVDDVGVYQTEPQPGPLPFETFSRLAPSRLEGGFQTSAKNDATSEFRLTTFVDGQESDYSRTATATPYDDRGGSALSLGGGAYGTVSERESLDLGEDGQTFSIEFWVKYEESSDTNAVILSKGGTPGSSSGSYMAHLVGSGEDRQVRFEFNNFNTGITSDDGIEAGVWNHVAFSWDGSTRTLYLNGEKDAQESESSSPGTNDQPLRIGSDQPATGHKLEGQVDEVRLWHDARTDVEIANSYLGQLVGDEDALAAYWRFDDAGAASARGSDAEHPTVQLENGATLGAPGVFPVPPRVYARGEAGNVTVTYRTRDNTTNVSVYRASQRDRSDRSQVGSLAAGRQAVFLDTGLTNDATKYYEATAIGPKGRESDYAFPAQALPSGRPAGNAFDFSGSNSYLTAGDRESLNLGENGETFTIEFWVKYDADADEDAVILSKGGKPDDSTGNYMAYLEGTGSERPIAFEFNNFNSYFSSNTDVRAGVWTHVAMTWDGSTRTLYINGEKDASESEGSSPGVNAKRLRIGADHPGTGHFFQGQIDGVRLWQTSRTAQQIETYYDRELIGDEPGLTGYWRGCQSGKTDFTWGQARRPMTASFNNVACVDSSIGLQTGNVVSRLNVTIDGAPNGLRAYSVTVETQSSTVIRSVTPGLIDGSDFRITDGGAGSANVTAQALDLNDDVGSFSGERTLYTVEYSGVVTPDDVTVSVDALQDDDQNSFSATVGVENATLPGPTAPDLSGDGNPATDTDGDGRFEDVSGDGSFNILDVSVFLSTFDKVSAGSADLFDFNNDGTINILDVSALLAET